ncbi:MAG: imidazoleglycerol-phosphate dehydratase HisB [Methanolinea sp.]|nr:imidazoleglycerol-phosphate dehydratase HisB [Methanolinea sp.]
MRTGQQERETKETCIRVGIRLDEPGNVETSTGIAFFDHMLQAMARHGRFGLDCQARGDLDVDTHHTIEDVGIVMGQSLRKAIGEGRGMTRFSHSIVPMDEALATVALDCGGRGYLVFEGNFAHPKVGGIEREIFEHFFYSLCIHSGITAHILFHGKNDHHKCEAIFKAFGIALGNATRISGEGIEIPSTKGTF